MRARWHGARSFDPALPELRRRTSWLARQLEPKARALIGLIPILLSARFKRPGLEADAPGLKLGPRRRRWGALCARLELPPPTAFTSSRPLVQSVLLVPTGDGRFELLVVPVQDVPPAELPRLVARVELLAALATRHATGLELRLASRAELTPSLIPWAAVCAGDLPPFEPGPVDRLEVVLRAPSSLSRCLALLVDDDAAPPLEVLRADHGSARPEDFVARWSASAAARAVANCERSSLAELQTTGSALREACLWALRRVPLSRRRALHALFRDDLLTSPLPAVFRPALERLLRGRSASEKVTAEGWVLEVDDVPLVRARSLDQLRADAVTQTPVLARSDGPWLRVAQMLRSGSARALLQVESGLLQHLVVTVAGAGRLRARRVDAEGLLRFAMSARARGVPYEVVAGLGSDQSLVTRLAQIATLPLRRSQSVGVEIGSRLLLADGHRVRSVRLSSALARPRSLTWLPADPELLRSLRRHSAAQLPTVHATAWLLAESTAAVYFLDPEGAVLREEVRWASLEAHLVESRQLLRQAPRPTLLSVTVHPTLTALAGRRLDAELPALDLDVECEWPTTLRVWLDGEAFCAPGDLSWSTLAEAVLSHWPPGTWGRVGVRRVTFIGAPPANPALHVLAVRSRVLRRVAAGLRRLSRVMLAA
jgi:hypothetical protein